MIRARLAVLAAALLAVVGIASPAHAGEVRVQGYDSADVGGGRCVLRVDYWQNDSDWIYSGSVRYVVQVKQERVDDAFAYVDGQEFAVPPLGIHDPGWDVRYPVGVRHLQGRVGVDYALIKCTRSIGGVYHHGVVSYDFWDRSWSTTTW